ncbi:oxysterol-binding protein-related protein 3-like [Danio aesculapii]|uniref:oxysterol-binding protein-related protein 3-like n=1 Tax=Danio aesculapii TaxID=1142201 RepID=UPI0024C0ABBC|nr:oxysterol-binding protein-related protein 3-like [Danio aesculapii]
MDRCTKELSVCEAQLLELNHLLRSMEVLHRTYSAPAINALQASTYDSPKKEKRHPRKWRPKNYGKDNKTTLQVPSCMSAGSVRLHASNPNLSSVDLTTEKTYHEPLDSPIDVSKLQEDFCRVANNLHTTMKSALCMLTTEKERVKTDAGARALSVTVSSASGTEERSDCSTNTSSHTSSLSGRILILNTAY